MSSKARDTGRLVERLVAAACFLAVVVIVLAKAGAIP